MKISLVICTFMRPKPLLNLLQSVEKQSFYPIEILIIDGSTDNETALILGTNNFKNCTYFQVDQKFRGLTKQRNFGIEKADKNSEIIAFLDDDTQLEYNYFEILKQTFENDLFIVGVGGVPINENGWVKKITNKKYNALCYEFFDGYVYKQAQRNLIRKILKLDSHLPPGKMPNYSHGKTCGFPLTGKTYEADTLTGMSFSFRKIVYENVKFSTYFEGYGLYEDAEFTIRAAKFGKIVVATNLKLQHFHNPFGRPNSYKYGMMVVRNGWYVWRTKNPKPLFRDNLKWHSITILLILIRYANVLSTNARKQALTESLGRTMGWLSLIFNKPK